MSLRQQDPSQLNPTSTPPVSRRSEPNHIPRPPNKFILYRSFVYEEMRTKGQVVVNGRKIHQNDISITVGDMWNNESPETKAKFEKLANQMAKEHKEKYPDYVFHPHTSRKKREEPNHIPRPPNKFILYRSFVYDEMRTKGQVEVNGKKIKQNNISITVGDMWNNESPETKAKFEQLANQIAKEHKEKYPDYVFTPNTSRKKRVSEKEDKSASHPYKSRSRRTTSKRSKEAEGDSKSEHPAASTSSAPAPFELESFDFMSDFPPPLNDAYAQDGELDLYFQNEDFSNIDFSVADMLNASMVSDPTGNFTSGSGYDYGMSQDYFPAFDAPTDPYYSSGYNY